MTKLAPFFIIGTDRSGTTMLRLMLNEHKELHVSLETWFIIDLMNSLPLNSPLDSKDKKLAYNIITQHDRRRNLGVDNEDLDKILNRLEKPYLRDILDAIFMLLTERHGKTYWGDKTPEYIKEIDRLHIVFPEARFIHIVRDGRDVCLSLLSKHWRGSMVSKIARYWAEYVSAGINAGRALPKDMYLEVTYESIVTDTEIMLKKICKFLNVNFDPCMLNFHENAERNLAPWGIVHHQKTMRAPSKEDIYRWKREATFLQIMAFEACAGSTMDLVGQKRKFNGISRILLWIFGFLNRTFFYALHIRREIKKLLPKSNKVSNNP